MASGRRTACIALLAVLAVLAAAVSFQEDLTAWFAGYRFFWAPEGMEPRWGKGPNAGGQFLVLIDAYASATGGQPPPLLPEEAPP